MSFYKKLFFQILVSAFAWYKGLRLTELDFGWLLPNVNTIQITLFLSFCITTIFIVALINAFNWLDGLDGLASGLISISSLGFGDIEFFL